MANKQSLKEKLTQWRTANEVHAKRSDKKLIEFLEDLIDSLPEDKEQATPKEENSTTQFIAPASAEDDGSNPPSGPATPP